MMRTFVLAVSLLGLVACSSDPVDSKERDGGRLVVDSGVDDGGLRDGGDSTVRDAGDGGDRDAGDRDGGADIDAGTRDAGEELAPELVPGSHVQVAEGRVTVAVDTLASVRQTFGDGVRGPANTRIYTWMLTGGVELSVWFANSTLGDASVIADDHRVLWAAVTGSYTGATPQGIAIGSTRGEVETAYGVAPHEVTITDPPGTLLDYFTTGILVAVDPANATRTITICRAYGQAPDGAIDPNGARIRLSGGDITGFRGLSGRGTSDRDVRNRLGEPDGEGDVTISGQQLHTLSYAFIGIELFFVDNVVFGADRVAFVAVHTPYYGTTSTGAGIGSDRASFESFLTANGYGAGTPSSTNAQLVCYAHGSDQDVGVTYSMAPEVVTSIAMPLLQCP